MWQARWVERARVTPARGFSPRKGPPYKDFCLLPVGNGSVQNKGKRPEVSLHLDLIRLHSWGSLDSNTFSPGSHLEEICKPVLRPCLGRQPPGRMRGLWVLDLYLSPFCLSASCQLPAAPSQDPPGIQSLGLYYLLNSISTGRLGWEWGLSGEPPSGLWCQQPPWVTCLCFSSFNYFSTPLSHTPCGEGYGLLTYKLKNMGFSDVPRTDIYTDSKNSKIMCQAPI